MKIGEHGAVFAQGELAPGVERIVVQARDTLLVGVGGARQIRRDLLGRPARRRRGGPGVGLLPLVQADDERRQQLVAGPVVLHGIGGEAACPPSTAVDRSAAATTGPVDHRVPVADGTGEVAPGPRPGRRSGHDEALPPGAATAPGTPSPAAQLVDEGF